MEQRETICCNMSVRSRGLLMDFWQSGKSAPIPLVWGEDVTVTQACASSNGSGVTKQWRCMSGWRPASVRKAVCWPLGWCVWVCVLFLPDYFPMLFYCIHRCNKLGGFLAFSVVSLLDTLQHPLPPPFRTCFAPCISVNMSLYLPFFTNCGVFPPVLQLKFPPYLPIDSAQYFQIACRQSI